MSMRSDTGLYIVAAVVLAFGLGHRVVSKGGSWATSRWTNAITRVSADAAPLLVVNSDVLCRRAQIAARIAQQRTKCAEALMAREQARMALVQARIDRELEDRTIDVQDLSHADTE